jgi:CRP-like cAMP-binding protein
MGTNPTLAVPRRQLEDPLAHLSGSNILEYRKGQVIYSQDQPSTNLYLIIEGKGEVLPRVG